MLPWRLDIFRRLATEAKARLMRGGTMMCEFGEGQSENLVAIFKNQNWIVEAVHNDYTSRPRILVVRVPG